MNICMHNEIGEKFIPTASDLNKTYVHFFESLLSQAVTGCHLKPLLVHQNYSQYEKNVCSGD